MYWDILIDLDDELIADYAVEAERLGTTVEELLRKLLIVRTGQPYRPLTVAEAADTSRPLLDLRTA